MTSTPAYVVAVSAIAVFLSGGAFGQEPDHLKCYKIKDPQAKATYSADLGGLAPASGCKIKVPATMLCVQTTKEIVQGTPPGGGPGGTPAGTFVCYQVRCPKTALEPVQVTDQFGTRTVAPARAKLVCAPATIPTITTTSSTTPTTCGGLVGCCLPVPGATCQLECRFGCAGGTQGCTVGEPCSTSTTTTLPPGCANDGDFPTCGGPCLDPDAICHPIRTLVQGAQFDRCACSLPSTTCSVLGASECDTGPCPPGQACIVDFRTPEAPVCGCGPLSPG